MAAFARRGEVAEHLPEVLARASGSPLLLFFDPCGRLLPFATLAKLLAQDRPPRPRPVTELLANFSADHVRRVGGRWRTEGHAESGEQLDAALGGQWWREIVTATVNNDDGWARAVGLIADGFADRLGQQTGMRSVVVPVRRLHHHRQPVYFLVLMTRSGHGQWMFADSVGRARKEWLEAHGPSADDSEAEGALFSHAATVSEQVNAERLKGVSVIEANLRALAGRIAPFRPVDHTLEILGAELGVATETQVGHALKHLVGVGVLTKVNTKPKPRDCTYRAAAR